MNGRRGYYPRVVAPTPAEPSPAPTVDQDNRLEPVVGMHAIAEELGITEQQLKSMLYPKRRGKTDGTDQHDDLPPAPIRKIRGLGLTADRATLQAWWRAVLTGRPVAGGQGTA